MRTINRNPRGVRKMDVQEERRLVRSESKEWAKRQMLWMNGRSEDDIQRAIRHAFLDGWERGVKDGRDAMLERLDEALANGTLVKR